MTEKVINQLGFQFARGFDVQGRLSISDLFPKSKNRCGIYLLNFSDNTFYIGQAIDNVKRFSQQRKNYDNIVNYWFQPTEKKNLDKIEQKLIQEAEAYGLLLTNKTFVSNVIGETDLDFVISPTGQIEWLEYDKTFSNEDYDLYSKVETKHKIKYRQNFQRLKKTENYSQIKSILNNYIKKMLPAYNKTELSFWSLSCLPSTNKMTFPRYFCLNVNSMEVFVLGLNKKAKTPFCFINLTNSFFESNQQLEKLLKKYKSLEIYESHYKAAGADQVCFEFSDLNEFENVLMTESKIIKSVKELNLRLMRKGGTIYSPYHCFDLVNDVLTHS
jgi:hypothetical protein